jgi:hypothetical protein
MDAERFADGVRNRRRVFALFAPSWSIGYCAMIPGRMLHRVATSLCSADFRERAIDALIADCQHEWVSARGRAGRLVVLLRCWTSFWLALAGCLAHDVRHDTAGFARKIAPVAWGSFCVVWWLYELSRNFPLMSVYMPAIVIWFYRHNTSERRSWAGCAAAILFMAAFLAARELLPEFRFILGCAAGSCVAASWTFLVKKDPSVVESSH